MLGSISLETQRVSAYTGGNIILIELNDIIINSSVHYIDSIDAFLAVETLSLMFSHALHAECIFILSLLTKWYSS